MEKTTRFSIKDWAEDDRPQERLLRYGPSALSLSELLAIILRTGTRSESALDLSKRVLSGVENDLSALGKLSPRELQDRYKGVGQAKAAMILSCLELGKRRGETQLREKVQLLNSRDVYRYMFARMADLPHEESWVLLLNNSNRLIAERQIGKGGISETLVDIRIVMKFALEALAPRVILCHNHPSGTLKPSTPDIKLTEKLRKALQGMDISLVDHLIVSEQGYYSFADEMIF